MNTEIILNVLLALAIWRIIKILFVDSFSKWLFGNMEGGKMANEALKKSFSERLDELQKEKEQKENKNQ